MFRQRTDHPTQGLHVGLVDDVLVVSGPDLDSVLTEVGARLGPDAEVLDAQRSIVGGIGGFFGRERFTVRARAALARVPDPDAGDARDTGSGEAPAMDGASFAAALAEALREAADQIASAEPLTGRLDPDAVHAGLGADAVELLHDPVALAREDGSTGVVQHPHERTVETAVDAAAWDRAALFSLGLRDLSDAELREQLAGLVSSPSVTPDAGVVAVVGDPSDAIATAELLARRAGLEPGDVLVAAPDAVEGRPAWLTIGTPGDAAARRERWARADRLTVVAVALLPGLDGLQWTREVLEALRAEQVRLAVAGWRRAEEVLPRLQGLGCVHAIDLCAPVDPDATADFLGLPVPVATLAGRPATAQGWFEQIRGRVVTEVHPTPADQEEEIRT